MVTPERVRAIQQIAAEMQSMEWTDIDLILKQFELSWSDSWSGSDPAAYVREMLSNAPDIRLRTLQDFVVGSPDGATHAEGQKVVTGAIRKWDTR